MKKKTKKYLLGAVIITVAVIGIKAMTASFGQVEPVQGAELTLSETDWDLGDIPMSEGITTREISLENKTDSAITITNMETSCMCTTAQIVHSDGSKSGLKGMVGHGGTSALSEMIQSGEVAILMINFDPNAHGPDATGPIMRNVSLETNSDVQPSIEFSFSGNVVK